jgi:hypothetical protein
MAIQCSACGGIWDTPGGLAYHQKHCDALSQQTAELLRSSQGARRRTQRGRRQLRHEENIEYNVPARKRRRRDLILELDEGQERLDSERMLGTGGSVSRLLLEHELNSPWHTWKAEG